MSMRFALLQALVSQSGGLPDEYRQVEYIESTGRQRIDTGVIPNNNFGFEIDQQQTQVAGQNNRVVDEYLLYNVSTVTLMFGSVNTSIASTDRHLVKANIINSVGKMYVDGNLVLSNVSFSLGTNGIIIFDRYSGERPAHAKLFSLRLYKNDTLVRDFLPVVRKSDSKPGLYDLVTRQFFVNQGTGEFLYPTGFSGTISSTSTGSPTFRLAAIKFGTPPSSNDDYDARASSSGVVGSTSFTDKTVAYLWNYSESSSTHVTYAGNDYVIYSSNTYDNPVAVTLTADGEIMLYATGNVKPTPH